MAADKYATQADFALALSQFYPCPCLTCAGHVRLISAPAPILTPEDRAMAAMAGRDLQRAWMPEGTPLAVCEYGHLDTAPGTDVVAMKEAVEETRRLSSKPHLTGSERKRLRRMLAKTKRFCANQRRHFRRKSEWWKLARAAEDITTPLDIDLPFTDLRVLEASP